MTHSEHASKTRTSVPCAAWHLTFGGRCLNCGFIPPSMVRVTSQYNVTGIHAPENCRECGAPFNNADAPKDRLCIACKE